MTASTHEAAALAHLAGQVFAGGAQRVEELHQAVADRAFRSPGARGARAVHDAIAGAVYGTVRGAGRAAGSAAARRAARRPERARLLSGSPRGAFAQSAINGWVGDRLAGDGSALAVEMAVRVGHRDLPLTPEAVADAYPGASRRIVVFTHGLGESEDAWRLRASARGGETYATRLEREHGASSVFVRCNTGLHISENGRLLADLLGRLVDAWPVPVERLDLVGHSMGGLIGRAACHVASERGDAWLDVMEVTVSLGTPHHGAPLEQAAHVGEWLLRRVPESAPLARLLETRSDGIKDLRFGAICEEDWADCEPGGLLDDRRVEVPLHDGARHYAVAATLTRSKDHPVARALGDALVLADSAHGLGRGGRRTGFSDEAVAHLGGVGHLALLNHPEVEERLVAWLA
ncbi:MAG TPA: alpha/beta hydrolase [Capillimicrobium sp.]|jgi:pimeloyl-ACP methyl ester carboxylesterase